MKMINVLSEQTAELIKNTAGFNNENHLGKIRAWV